MWRTLFWLYELVYQGERAVAVLARALGALLDLFDRALDWLYDRPHRIAAEYLAYREACLAGLREGSKPRMAERAWDYDPAGDGPWWGRR